MNKFWFGLLTALVCSAATPPMGWNSWDSYGLTVTQNEFKANAEWLAQNLRSYGWNTAVVDEGWYLSNPESKPGSFVFVMDANGRYNPAKNRFPEGLKGLADWTHSQGLKFGIHIIRGIPREAVQRNLPIANSSFKASDAADQSDTCRWNSDNYGVRGNAAGQAYYDSVVSLYASWGVDFLKVDCITTPYKRDEIHMIHNAIRKTGRPILLSLSPGPTPIDEINDLRQNANMWRISDDVWDHWKQWPDKAWSQGILAQFAMAAKWAPLSEPDHWPDADMLPIGHLGPRPGLDKDRQSRLTQEEQRTMITLWSMLRSPLILGANLTKMDEATKSLLTNAEVLAVDQHSSASRAVVTDAKKAIWVAKPDAGGGAYLALFNLDDSPQAFDYPLQGLGVCGTAACQIRDLWAKADKGSTDRLKITLAPHAAALYRVKGK